MKSLFVFLFFMVVGGCSKAEDELTDSQKEADDRSWVTWDTCSQKPQDHPCNFALSDQDGNEVELYDYYGKVIIVDLSTMWCGVCQNIAHVGKNLVDEYGSENLVWLTILVEDEMGQTPDGDDLNRWIDSYGGHAPVLAADRSIIDPTAEKGYPVSGWPTVVIINKDMVLTNGINGWSEDYVRQAIESNL